MCSYVVACTTVCRSSCIPSSTVSSVCGTSEPICRLTDEARLGVYGGITVISIALNFLRTVMFYLICLNASKVLHNRMFAAIIRVPMRFFDINPSGECVYVLRCLRVCTDEHIISNLFV